MNLSPSASATRLRELVAPLPQSLWQHSLSVSALAADLARSAGCDPVERERIRLGSRLHDIGKQFIPAAVLEKQGQLTDREFDCIRQHPRLGHEYLFQFTSDATVLNTVLYHHERWNGSGYPHGLAGEEIPLGARICALADVWDALVSDRCYRSAWSLTQAMDLIWAGAGSLFDPDLACHFLALLETRHWTGSLVELTEPPTLPPTWRSTSLATGLKSGLKTGLPPFVP